MEVSGIEIKSKSGKKIVISVEEAKDLYEHLNELFGKKYMQPNLPFPVIIEKTHPYVHDWPVPQTWCGTTGLEVRMQSNVT